MTQGAATQQEQGKATGQRPSIGRIVVYNATRTNEGHCPALIQALNAENGGLTLCVFGPHGTRMQLDVQQGDGPGQWQWPERT